MPWAPDYVEVADLAAFVRTNADNPYVGTYGTAASRAIDDWCNRQFGRLDQAAAFTYRAARAFPVEGRWLLEVDDIQDLSAVVVTVDGTTVTEGSSGWQAWEDNAIAKGYPHTALTFRDRPCGDVVVSTRFGWTAQPACVAAAVWLQVNRWNVRQESPYGVAGSVTDGSEMRLAAKLDPDVRVIVGPVRRARMPQ